VTGSAGSIDITHSGSVSATGNGSSAIYTNSQGQNHGPDLIITNNAGGQITGNSTVAAIMLTGGNADDDGTVNCVVAKEIEDQPVIRDRYRG
jgi:hypothetical protein